MPLKIQAYCKETNQEVPWKPGPIIRCVLESLALLYRKVLTELEYLTGRGSTRLCFLGLPQNILLKSFIANALQLPTLIAPPEAAAIGNIAVQAVALGHINSLDEAREIVRHSVKMETIMPHATIWDTAYQRFVELAVASVPAA
jgi:sugar (pentulose or hexulose) kinase